jgi:hypothetical protein
LTNVSFSLQAPFKLAKTPGDRIFNSIQGRATGEDRPEFADHINPVPSATIAAF